MPQFAKRSTKPLQPESYRAAARKLRRFADKLEARCAPSSPRELASLTSAVHALVHFARALSARHNKRPLYEPPGDL